MRSNDPPCVICCPLTVVVTATLVPIALFGVSVAVQLPFTQVKFPSDAPFCAVAVNCPFAGGYVPFMLTNTLLF